jgi:hypothetical protein
MLLVWLPIGVESPMLVIVPGWPGQETYTSQELILVNSENLDHLADTLQESQPRRGVLRMLGVAALGASGVSILAHEGGDARKQSGKKSGKKRCKPGKSIASVQVPANGTTVTSPVLKQGQRYRLRANGFWNTNAQYGNDAFAAFQFANPNTPELTYKNVRLGLSVNGGSPDQWGNYNTNHTYELQFTGQGQGVTFRFTDPETNDNSGSLTVSIECA